MKIEIHSDKYGHTTIEVDTFFFSAALKALADLLRAAATKLEKMDVPK